ncbi:MAG: hypothetical protein E7076_05440 [Bacteroidales bacterium]|nr:hypothetical protein [Bacteroidales bacterium]
MQQSISYIIRFLFGEDLPDSVFERIGYTNNADEYEKYEVVIVRSDFFDEDKYGKKEFMPQLPLKSLDGMPFFFGDSRFEHLGDTLVIYADLVASAYFLVSRYEEWLSPLRDEHGRFLAKYSILKEANLLQRPLVDEYRMWLRIKLQTFHPELPSVRAQFSKIYLTHDVDVPFVCRSWRNVLSSVLRGEFGVFSALKYHFADIRKNPYFTFPYIFEQNKHIDAQSVIFVKSGGNARNDRPFYDLNSDDIQTLFDMAKANGVQIGLHASYASAQKLIDVRVEKKSLENAVRDKVTTNRCHYLRTCNPQDFTAFDACGITDDFTMAFADEAGFRLGTCYSVRYINPVDGSLHALHLHPLALMDVTLEKYMRLSGENALNFSMNMLQAIKSVGGEVTLLWHNNSFYTSGDYHRPLYKTLLKTLKK